MATRGGHISELLLSETFSKWRSTFPDWFFLDRFSTKIAYLCNFSSERVKKKIKSRISFFLTLLVLKMQCCNFVTKGSNTNWRIHSDPFFDVKKRAKFHNPRSDKQHMIYSIIRKRTFFPAVTFVYQGIIY